LDCLGLFLDCGGLRRFPFLPLNYQRKKAAETAALQKSKARLESLTYTKRRHCRHCGTKLSPLGLAMESIDLQNFQFIA
jgi:hypothetical protein